MSSYEPAPARHLRLWPALQAHLLLIALFALVGAAAAAALATALPTQYIATSSVLVQPLDGNPYSPTGSGSDLVRLETEAQVVSSDEIVDSVREALPPQAADLNLTKGLGVVILPNTQIVEISFRSGRADVAEVVSRQYADSYLQYRSDNRDQAMDTRRAGIEASLKSVEDRLRELRKDGYGPDTPEVRASGAQLQNLRLQLSTLDTSDVRAGQVSIAPVARRSGLSVPLNLAVPAGLLLGALVAGATSVMRERHLERLRSVDDIEQLSVPVLGHLRVHSVDTDQHLLPDAALMVAAVFTRRVSTPSAVIAVGAVSGETPTGFAAQLAQALAHGRQHVLFIDAASTDRSDQPGFTDALSGSADFEAMMTDAKGELSTLAVGTDPKHGMRLYGTPRLDRILRRATESFDWVIIHAPDTGQTSGRALVAGCDFWVPTVAIGADTRDDLERGLQWAETTGTQVLGVVAVDRKAGSTHLGMPVVAAVSEFEEAADETAPDGDDIALEAAEPIDEAELSLDAELPLDDPEDERTGSDPEPSPDDAEHVPASWSEASRGR